MSKERERLADLEEDAAWAADLLPGPPRQPEGYGTLEDLHHEALLRQDAERWRAGMTLTEWITYAALGELGVVDPLPRQYRGLWIPVLWRATLAIPRALRPPDWEERFVEWARRFAGDEQLTVEAIELMTARLYPPAGERKAGA